MDVSTIFNSVILPSVSGVSTLILIVLIFGKKWIESRIENGIKHRYARELEEHKAKSARDLEEHKAKLQEQTTFAIRKLEMEYQESAAERAVDEQLFERFLEALPSNGGINFINYNNFAGFEFERRYMQDLWDFCNAWNDAEHEFLDRELEKKRKHLYALIREYLNNIARNTFPVGRGTYSVPEEWEVEDPDRFWSAVNRLHDMAGEIVEAHTDLVRFGRLKLKYVPPATTTESSIADGPS